MNTIEIELRYEILDFSTIASFVAPLEFLHRRHDIDHYFDTITGWHNQRGLYLRTRNGSTLNIKFNRPCLEDPTLPIQDFCEEHSFPLPLSIEDMPRLNKVVVSIGLHAIENPSFEEFKMVNDLDLFYSIDKVRTSYRFEELIIAVDQVRGLGNFLEIELMTNDTNHLVLIKEKMHMLVMPLHVRPSPAGYETLLMRKNNFDQYLKSRFVLECDRHLITKQR